MEPVPAPERRRTSAATASRRPGPLARLDRIPVWPYEKRLLWVVGAGYFFAFFDIVTISFALPVIATQFHASKGAVSLSVTSSLIGYIIGAIGDSQVADKWGRKLSLAVSVTLFSVGTALAALSWNVGSLVAFRFISGLGIGAEIAAVTTYLSEISPAPLRGRYTSWATTAAYAGFAVVPFVARVLVPNYAAGWRILFAIGAIGGVTILFMRRGLPASPRWLVSQGRPEEAAELVAEAEDTARENLDDHEELPPPEPVPDEAPAETFPLRALLRQPMAGRLALFIGVWFVYYIGNYGWLTLAPTLFTDKGYSLADSTSYLIVSGHRLPGRRVCHDTLQRPLRAQAHRGAVRRPVGDLAAGDRPVRVTRDHHRVRLHRLDDGGPARTAALHLHRRALRHQRTRDRRGDDRRARPHRRGAGPAHRARRQRGVRLLRRVHRHGGHRPAHRRVGPSGRPDDGPIAGNYDVGVTHRPRRPIHLRWRR